MSSRTSVGENPFVVGGDPDQAQQPLRNGVSGGIGALTSWTGAHVPLTRDCVRVRCVVRPAGLGRCASVHSYTCGTTDTCFLLGQQRKGAPPTERPAGAGSGGESRRVVHLKMPKTTDHTRTKRTLHNLHCPTTLIR